MIEFNLLPEEKRVNASLYNTLKLTRSLGTILLAVFIIFLGGCLVYFATTYVKLKNIEESNTQLADQVRALETSEQQLILLKDRIAKIDEVFKTPDSQVNLKKAESLLTTSGGNTTFGELGINPNGITVSLVFDNHNDVSTFFGNITKSDQFTTVKMENLSLVPATGYIATFSLETKNEE